MFLVKSIFSLQGKEANQGTIPIDRFHTKYAIHRVIYKGAKFEFKYIKYPGINRKDKTLDDFVFLNFVQCVLLTV